MSRGGADSALVGFQHGRNHNGVGLGASGEEEDAVKTQPVAEEAVENIEETTENNQ